jgi:protein TonB
MSVNHSKITLIFLFVCIAVSAFAQTNGVAKTARDTMPFMKPQILPKFPGGDAGLIEFMSVNIKYPEKAKKKGNVGTSYISFIISKSGKVTDIKTYKGIPGCGPCDEEAKRVVRMMPEWVPGKQDGKAIDVQYVLPVKFSLK